MNVTSTQSQSLVATVLFSRTSARASSPSVPAPPNDAPAATDVVEVGTPVDAGFAARVLQDSLQERLDAALKKAGVDTSVEELLTSGLDTSPKATAKRIVDFSTSFLPAYIANHQKDEAGTRLDNYTTLVKGAVDEGFAGARDLLSLVGEVPDEVAGGIDQTCDLVMKGIDTFTAEQRQALDRIVSGETPVSPI